MTSKQFKETYTQPWIQVLTSDGYIEHYKANGTRLYSSLGKAKAAVQALRESGKYSGCFLEIWAVNKLTEWPERVF